MGKRAFLFPGQGAQYVGMAKDLFECSAEAKEMIRMADDALQVPLSQIMFSGPEEQLRQTEFTQPAIFLHSVVLASLMRTVSCDGSAGHSLGEFSALVSAGAVQFLDAVQLVRARGVAMQKAGTVQKGTMAAVVGLEPKVLEDICLEASAAGIVQCANFNSPGQIAISGSVDGVHKGMELAKAKGARMVKELVVSGAFHSPLMVPAQEELKAALSKTPLFDPKFPVYANVTAKPETTKEEVHTRLLEQLTAPVRWQEIIENMIADGFDEFIEIGPGKVLQGLVKRINPAVRITGIDTFKDVEQYL